MRARLILIAAGLLVVAQPVSAKIIRRQFTPSETWDPALSTTWSPLLPLTIGGGFEFQTDSEQSEYDFPLFLEYNFSETFKLTIEPDFVYIDSNSPDVTSVGGFGDLETSVEWEFLRERRYRPALTAVGLIKWPTASDPDLGDPGEDYTAGLIASKDFVYVDVDLSALYTFSGDPDQQDTVEIALAAQYPLNRKFDLVAELVDTIETGHGAPGRAGNDFEGTVGIAWHVNSYLKLEQGFSISTDGRWQILFGWEFSFAGED